MNKVPNIGMEPPILVELKDIESNKPVYVNPEYVTFVQPNPVQNTGAIVGLVGDELGCTVSGTTTEVAKAIGLVKPAPSPNPHSSQQSTMVRQKKVRTLHPQPQPQSQPQSQQKENL